MDRLPVFYDPTTFAYLSLEGAGEVQTPIKVKGKSISIGDTIYFRHAKAGELCERFQVLHAIRGDKYAGPYTTYRGWTMFSIENWRNGEKWTNWAGNVISYPSEMYLPHSIDEVSAIVKHACQSGKTIRVTGAAHSFSAVAMPEHIAISLHNLRGLIAVNEERQEATLWAGTYLYEIGPMLAKHGFALINMGDIQEQTIAGAVSTGTHGTGVTLGSLSSAVEAWGFVDGTGTYQEHRRGMDDLSEALHVSLGMLGVLVKVTIKVMPLYGLHYIGARETLTNGLSLFAEDIRQHRHVEWFYFPGSETIQVKRMNAVAPVFQSEWNKRIETLKLQIVENGAFFAMSELCKWKPRLSGAMSKIAAANVVESEK